jgi:hypothetical protein
MKNSYLKKLTKFFKYFLKNNYINYYIITFIIVKNFIIDK